MPQGHALAAYRKKAAQSRLRKELKEEFGHSNIDIHAIQPEELRRVWVSQQREAELTDQQIADKYKAITGSVLNLVREHTGNAMSAVAVGKLAQDMSRSGNILGAYRIKQIQGRTLVLFQGSPNLRKHLKARVFGSSHPKIVAMGIGRAGALSNLRTGIVITLILSPVIRTIEWLFIDQKSSLEAVLGRISTDLVKGIIALGAGYFVSSGTAVALSVLFGSVVAVAPVAFGFLAAVAVGAGLNILDGHYGITDKLIEAMVTNSDQWERERSRISSEFGRYFGSFGGQMSFIRGISGM